MRKHLAAALALALPFVAIALVSRLVVGAVATTIAGHLSDASMGFSPLSVPEPVPVSASSSECEAETPPALDPPPAPRARSKITRRRARVPSVENERRAIFVPRVVVERAIRAHHHPTGAAVGPSNSHPAGVGVSGGAAPLQPGDVITDVNGHPVRSVEEIVVAVANALHTKPKAVSGRFWRGGEAYTVTVEIPW